MNDLVKMHVEDRIAFLEIDHPPANALSRAVLDDLARAVEHIEADTGVKVAVITGAGKFFVAGADIKEMSEQEGTPAGEALAKHGQHILNRIEASAKPYIAAINGACLGGGLELAMACHLRYAASGAKLGQPEINLGLIPGFGGTQRLPRLIGQAAALEMLLTGAPVSAEDAHALGLVNRVVAPDQLREAAIDIALQIAKKGRLASEEILRAVRTGGELPLVEALALEAEAFGRAFGSSDKDEGIAAFLEKREPQFDD